MKDAQPVPLDQEHIGIKGGVIHQQWSDAQVAYHHRYAGVKCVGPFQSGQNGGAALGVTPGQTVVERQYHIPGSLSQKQWDFR